MWAGDQTVRLRVRQKADVTSAWSLDFHHDATPASLRKLGETAEKSGAKTELKGTDWQTLSFDARIHSFLSRAGIVPDGFVIAIDSPEDNVIKIQSLRITRTLYEGYCRKEFVCPEGKVWRAVAEVGYGMRLYANGREVPIQNSVFQLPRLDGPADYQSNRRSPDGPGTLPVDLAPYLKSGRNCIGIYAKQVQLCLGLYLQCRVVMESGATVSVQTDNSWRYSRNAPDGWSSPSFDDSGWAPVSKTDFSVLGYLVSDYLIEGGGYWMGPAFPPYDGRIVIENPATRESCLYFDDGQPLIVNVRVPAGLAERRPTIAWQLTGYDLQTHAEPLIREGEVKQFQRSDGSLVYAINGGRLDHGVYALGIVLRDGEGQTIESRWREPLMVIGPIPMKEVNGDSYEEGLDLTLEDEIDFTNPNDPHPSLETSVASSDGKGRVLEIADSPRIVRKNGLTYRETAPNTGRPVPTISYQLKLNHPGDYYLMVMEYPNDAERWTGLSVAVENDGVTRAGPSVWTGDRYPITNTMKELKWLYRAEPGVTTVSLVPIQRNSTAAAARLRVYHVRGELPALRVRPPESGQRRIGIYTERTAAGAGFWRTFGRIPAGGVFGSGQYGKGASFRPIPERLNYLTNALDACEQFTRYLRFTGQNLHAMGTMQYYPSNTGYSTRSPDWDCRVPRDLRETAIRVFGRNGIDVVANISYAGHRCLQVEDPYNDGQVALGQDTAIIVSKDGAQPPARDAGRGYGSGWNALHPRIRELMAMAAGEAPEKYKDQPNFRGVCWTSYLTGEWLPGFGGMNWRAAGGALGHSYDDATIRQFVKDTGIGVPGTPDDPERFGRRHDFLTAGDMREKWVAWRCGKVRELFGLLKDRVQAVRPDLDLFSALYIDVGHDTDWTEKGKPLDQYLREWGYDLALYRDDADLQPARWVHAIFHSYPAGRRQGWPAGLEQTAGKEFLDLYSGARNRAAVIMHQWNEVSFNIPEESSWPRQEYTGRLLTQPNGDNARETFTLLLAGTDPQQIMYAFMDVNMIAGHEQELREFIRTYRALPSGGFKPALDTDLTTNLCIAELREGDTYYLRVANPGCWSIRGRVTVTGAGGVQDAATGHPVDIDRREGDTTIIPVELDPYGIAAFRIAGRNVRAVSWSTDAIAAQDRAHLGGIIALTERLLQNPDAIKQVKDDDVAFLKQSIETARADLKAGRIAKAWATLTYWRFWNAVALKMKPAVGP